MVKEIRFKKIVEYEDIAGFFLGTIFFFGAIMLSSLLITKAHTKLDVILITISMMLLFMTSITLLCRSWFSRDVYWVKE